MKKKVSALVRDGVGYVKTYWNAPPKGKALSVKEWLCYCLGGIGAVGATVIPTYITMGAGIYIAVALNINVDHIVTIGVITSIATIATAPLISYIIDNTNSKYGKFRPYLIWLPIPILILFFATAWIPTLMTSTYFPMLVVYTVLYNLLQFLIRIYSLSFTSIVQVISPSPEERTNLMSFGTFVTSLGPSLVNMLYPLVANVLFTSGDIQGINTVGAVRWVAPIFAAVFFALGYFTAFGTKERMVLPRTHKQKQRFFAGVAKTAKNKYFWLTNISTAIGVFKMFIATTFTVWICSWVIAPQLTANGHEAMANTIQSIVVTLMGFANVPGMLLAPLFIKKFGKRNLVVYTNLIIVVLTVPMCIFVNSPYLLLVLMFMQNMLNGIQVVTGPAMNAQLYDYQQYRTGDRLEGFISQFGLILTTAAGIGTAYVAPAVYKHFGYFNDATVLLDNTGVLFPIIRIMGYIAIGSGLLCTIPMLFWNLTEKKHDRIMEVLRVRSKFADGECTEEEKDELERRIMDGDDNVFTEFFGESYVEDDNIAAVTPQDVAELAEDAANADPHTEDALGSDDDAIEHEELEFEDDAKDKDDFTI